MRFSPSPWSLNNSASHRLFIAFLIRLAGSGEGVSKELASEDSGGGCLGSECSGNVGWGRKDSDTGCSDSEGGPGKC
jgi:hypothetical protein